MGWRGFSVFSFFDLVCSQSYSCVTCSELRQHCVLAVSNRCRGPRTVGQCRKWVRRSEDRSDLKGCGNDKREQMRWKKGEQGGIRERDAGGTWGNRRSGGMTGFDWFIAFNIPCQLLHFLQLLRGLMLYYFVSKLLSLLTNLVDWKIHRPEVSLEALAVEDVARRR